MPVSIFVSRLGIIDLVNKIKIDTTLIKIFHSEIYMFGKFFFLLDHFLDLFESKLLEYRKIFNKIFIF